MYSIPVEEHSIVIDLVCVSVCPRTYLQNPKPQYNRQQFLTLVTYYVVVARYALQRR